MALAKKQRKYVRFFTNFDILRGRNINGNFGMVHLATDNPTPTEIC
jgi:hypothetical protein